MVSERLLDGSGTINLSIGHFHNSALSTRSLADIPKSISFERSEKAE